MGIEMAVPAKKPTPRNKRQCEPEVLGDKTFAAAMKMSVAQLKEEYVNYFGKGSSAGKKKGDLINGLLSKNDWKPLSLRVPTGPPKSRKCKAEDSPSAGSARKPRTKEPG